ncbi:MAG: hypothetical protein PHH54_05460 [Candidatus Nanoarchaeia archaeon]|nr:hypothetical protein [Candidatus Nanoarchaeia archaeon]MDD5741406.1 hypothetical protein [Candidatus Nanoarchaeia archaeon]
MKYLNDEEQLKQKILELKEGARSLAEIHNDIIGAEHLTNKSSFSLHLASYADYTKIKTLLQLFNQNYDCQEMQDLEKETDENIKDQEENILKFLE